MKDEEKSILRVKILNKLKTPRSDNIFYIRYAMLTGASINEIHNSTKIDKWFLNQIMEIVETERELHGYEL